MSAYRKIGVFAAVIGVLALLGGCQQQAKVAQEPVEAAALGVAAEVKQAEPKIKFESLVYDFGKVGPAQKMAGEFKFTNAGDAPLAITKVEKCCGAVTKLDKEELAPGESGSLQVQYTSGRMAGAMSKKLYVNSNDAATPRAELTIKAQTVLRVNYEPKSLKLLLKDENAACPKITLKSTDNEPFRITRFTASNNALTADIDPAVEATKFVIEPKPDAARLQKTRNGRISIDMAFGQPDTPPETISIYFNALTRFSVLPASLLFVYDKLQVPVKKTLWIANNYGEDFEIESAVSKEGHIKVLSRNKVGNRYQFSLEITPPDESIKRFEDTFTLTLQDGQTLEVPCRGYYRPPKPKPASQ